MTNGVYAVRKADITQARRRLDDMLVQGLDYVTIDFWRQILDGYEGAATKLQAIEEALSTLESGVNDVGLDIEPIGNIGLLDDIEQLSPLVRKDIQDAIDAKDAERSAQAVSAIASAEAYLRHGIAELQAAIDGEEKPKPPGTPVKPTATKGKKRA